MSSTPPTQKLPGHDLRARISELGADLASQLRAITEAVPGRPAGPQRLAKALGLDKVFTSRLLKALRNGEPLSVVHQLPGPDPLKRFLVAAKKVGVPSALLAPARLSVDSFESLIRDEAGDRTALGSILSAWLPEVREQLDMRARQAAYRAMCQIRGVQAELDYSAGFLYPAEGGRLDVVWLIGISGLYRLRPGALVKCDTLRVATSEDKRGPTNLKGESVSGRRMLLEEFISGRPAPLVVEPAGEVMHYLLGETGFGHRSAVEVLFCEVNRGEMPATVPTGSGRKAWFYADVAIPVRSMCLDFFVHKDVYPGNDPQTIFYDKSSGGIADVNDRSRDIDRLDLHEDYTHLGNGIDRTRIPELPRYQDLLAHVYDSLGWNSEEFRGYRTRIEYPVHRTQVTYVFQPPEAD